MMLSHRLPGIILRLAAFTFALAMSVIGASRQLAAAEPPSTQRSTLSGRVTLVTTPPKDVPKFSYAVLYVDSVGCSVTNSAPLRFEIDTTTFSNGTHSVKVVLFDEVGSLVELKPFPVTILNAGNAQPTSVKPVEVPVKSQGWQEAVPIILYRNAPVLFELPPFITEGRTMALLRPLILLADGYLAWKGQTGTAFVAGHKILFTLNQSVVLVDGNPVMLLRPIVLQQNRVYAPVTLWRDIFSGTVDYTKKNCTITLHDFPKNIPAAKP